MYADVMLETGWSAEYMRKLNPFLVLELAKKQALKGLQGLGAMLPQMQQQAMPVQDNTHPAPGHPVEHVEDLGNGKQRVTRKFSIFDLRDGKVSANGIKVNNGS